MDLYFVPLAGSFAVHVACLEAGITPVLHLVDAKTKRLPDGRDYRQIVPHGIVPAIGLPDGGVLTELTAVLPYVADRAPAKQLAPAPDSPERYRLIEWLAFIATELHKKHLQPVFGTNVAAGADAWSRANVDAMFAHVARRLDHHDYLLDAFSVADCYLFWVLFVAPHGGLSLNAHPSLKAYVERIRARASVTAALAIEVPLYTAAAAAGTAPVSRRATT
ncbi:MAG TPA: glutathione S-transferase C-terminal domain-containing protein [Kofleriaceae bacterium]|nr:glutathione S-transferase C-terminal domain-containing protein [Kofleriaceae bacterium]